MRFEPSFPPPITKPRRYRWLQLILLLGFSLCFLISIIAVVALWWLASDTTVPRTPQAIDVEATQVVPALALMYLAGDPIDALAHQAFRAEEYETSHALLTFGLPTMPVSRVTLILQLVQQFRQQEKPSIAAQLLRKSRAIAILDTQLAPLERADILLQCAKEFLAIELVDEATDAAYQVKYLVEQTPDLLPAERSRVLQNLVPLIRQLDDDLLRQQVQELARSPYLEPKGVMIQRTLHLSDGSLEFGGELSATLQERQQLARKLAEQLIQSPLADVTPLLQVLEQTLRKEDEQRTLYFKQILTSENLTFSLQFWTLHEQRNWLLLKLAIAYRGFGLSIVPAWEADRLTIMEDLTEATDQLDVALSTVPDGEAEIFDQLLQRIAALHWLALQTELGFYSQQRAAEVGEQLRIAQEELATYGASAALPIRYERAVTPPGYRIGSTR